MANSDPITQETLQRIIKTELEPFATMAKNNAKAIDKLTRYTFGNGSPGADERLNQEERITIRHEQEIKSLKDFIKDLQPVIMFYKVGIWMAGALGLSILGLIWSLITGQVSLVFK